MATRVVKIESWVKDCGGLCVEHVKHDQTVQLEATDWAAVNPDIGSHDCDRLASDTSTDSQRQNKFLKAFTTFYNTTINCFGVAQLARARMHPKPLFQRGPMSGPFQNDIDIYIYMI